MKRILTTALMLGMATGAFSAIPASLKAEPPKVQKTPPWMLGPFMDLSRKNPARLLRITEKLFAKERIDRVRKDPTLAFEWQHRLAAIEAISDFFDPENHVPSDWRERARALIKTAMLGDPSLLVRDGAVEAARRIFRMNTAESKRFAPSLEQAFMDRKNILDGEGFFIRETILVAMRDGQLTPSKRVKLAALQDANENVRNRLKLWKTSTYGR